MTTKKIFGYIFIVIAVILALAIVGQLPQLFAAVFGFFKIFTGTLDSYQIGQVIGVSFPESSPIKNRILRATEGASIKKNY